jgi:GTP pyrophosphokinase
MVGAKINGMIAPIDKCPQNGEIVEILTSSASKGPSRDWLKIVKTGEARNKIRQWFKKEKRSENIVIGRAEIDKEINRLARHSTEAQRLEIITKVAHRIGMQEADDLCNTIGYGGLAISKILPKLKDEVEKTVKPEVEEQPKVVEVEKIKTAPAPAGSKSGGIIVDGQRGCAVKFAKCCNPLPGDPIIGFITKGYGVSIHKRDCPNVTTGMKSEEFFHRWIHADWDLADIKRMKDSSYEAVVQIFAEDNISLIANVTMALADMKVSITQINTRKHNDTDVIINLKFACKDTNHYNSVVSRLKGIPHVNNIIRGLN